MAKDTIAAEKDGQDTRSTLKATRSADLRHTARLREYLIRREYRRRCSIGLAELKTMAYEELYISLANFAHEQWEQLPTHASQWERGQVDGLFWALDKLDEIVVK